RQSSLDTKGIGRADAVFADNARRAALRLSSQARCMSRSTRTAFLRITSVPERRPQFNGLRDWRFVRRSHWTDILRRSLPPTASTRQSQPRSDLGRISAQHAAPPIPAGFAGSPTAETSSSCQSTLDEEFEIDRSALAHEPLTFVWRC